MLILLCYLCFFFPLQNKTRESEREKVGVGSGKCKERENNKYILMCWNSLFHSSITFKPFSRNKYNMQWVVVRPAFIFSFQFLCMFFLLVLFCSLFFCLIRSGVDFFPGCYFSSVFTWFFVVVMPFFNCCRSCITFFFFFCSFAGFFSELFWNHLHLHFNILHHFIFAD